MLLILSKRVCIPQSSWRIFFVSVDAEHLFHSTLHTIITSENLDKSLQSFASCRWLQMPPADGLYHKRHQLSGDDVEDTLSGSSVNYLGVFMTPIAVTVVSGDDMITVWENLSPKSIFYTRPVILLQAKESRSIVEKIFPGIQESIDKLRMPHTVDGIINPVFVDTQISMIEGKWFILCWVILLPSAIIVMYRKMTQAG